MSNSFIQFLAFLFVLGLAFFGDSSSGINKASKLIMAVCFAFWLVVNAVLEIKHQIGW